jgi:hypothetical protein
MAFTFFGVFAFSTARAPMTLRVSIADKTLSTALAGILGTGVHLIEIRPQAPDANPDGLPANVPCKCFGLNAI